MALRHATGHESRQPPGGGKTVRSTYATASSSKTVCMSSFATQLWGRPILLREKMGDEVAAMKHLRRHTPRPVPEVLGSGICLLGSCRSFVEDIPLSNLLKGQFKKEIAGP
ncbi:hypothetical protein LOZ58_001488, partial [Ophidiomyces ophidiicola]